MIEQYKWKNMNVIYYLRFIALIFTIIGVLNWGLIGLQGVEFVSQLFGPTTPMSKAVYTYTGEGFGGLSSLYI